MHDGNKITGVYNMYNTAPEEGAFTYGSDGDVRTRPPK